MPRLLSRLMTSVFAAVVVMWGAAAQAQDAGTAGQFISDVVTEAVDTFGGKTLAKEERGQLFRDRLLRYARPAVISEMILGRYWSHFTDAEKTEFQTLLVDYVVAMWGDKLADIAAGTTIAITSTDVAGDKSVVHSQVTEPGSPPTPVDWTVVGADTPTPTIIDLAADGISVITTLKADFTSVLRANNGQLAPLLAAMHKKMSLAN